jgi:hypothetical protein
LREVHRQREPWDRDALSALRGGDAERFAAAYHAHGRLIAAPTADAARDALADDWWRALQVGERALMIAHRRSDVADLNRRARALLRDAGRVGSDALRTDRRAFAIGDRVVTTRNNPSLAVVNGQAGTLRRFTTASCVSSSTTAGASSSRSRTRRTDPSTTPTRRPRTAPRVPPWTSRSCSAPTSSTANGATPRSPATVTRHASTFTVGRDFLNQAPEPLRDGDVPLHVARLLADSRAEHLALDRRGVDRDIGLGL